MSGFSSKNKRKSKNKKKLMFLFAKKKNKKPLRSKFWGMLNKEKKHAFFSIRKKINGNSKNTKTKKFYHKSTFQLGTIIAVAILSGVYLIYHIVIVGAVSATYTVSTQIEWEDGEYQEGLFNTMLTKGDLQIAEGAGSLNPDTPGWPERLRGYPILTDEGATNGADLTTDGKYIYMIIGGSQPGLFRYNPEITHWTKLHDAPTGFNIGAAITYYDGAIYAINADSGTQGADADNDFYKYDIASDSWSQIEDAPGDWAYGSDIESGRNGKIYAVHGNSTDEFWSYNVLTNTWSDTAPSIPAPYQVYTTNGHPLEYAAESFGTDPVYCESGCLYAFRGNNFRQFFRFDLSMNQWFSGFSDIPANLPGVNYGSAMTYDSTNGNIYAFHGNGNDEFSKYDVDTETWDTDTADTTDYQLTVREGGSLAFLDNYIYALSGRNYREFGRYDVTAGKWTSIHMPAPTGNTAEDGLMIFVEAGTEIGGGVGQCDDSVGCLYVARGANTNTFDKYEVNNKTWVDITDPTTGGLRNGATMCYDGSDNIFLLEGDNTLNTFAYTLSTNSWASTGAISGTVGDEVYVGGSITCMGDNDAYVIRGDNDTELFRYNGSWSKISTDPVPNTVYYGGAATNDGTYVYAIPGYQRGTFFRYDPSGVAGSRWTEMASLPTSSYYTASLEFDGDNYIYALPGRYSTDFYRYDILAGEWSRITDIPTRTLYSNALSHDDTNHQMFITRGYASYAIWKYDTADGDFIDTATWISDILDLTYATSFNSFSSTAKLNGQSIAFHSRTSDDQVTWSDWALISGSSIASPANRYIQIKVVMNTNGVSTPSLSDFTINYEKDSSNPSNPAVTGYADESKLTGISTGNSYYHINPYFEFSGALDGESGLEGYYVSWTTNASHDPTASEDYFQTTETYSVHEGLTAGNTYYLRVSTKDQADNTATVQTLFTYTYTGISPAQTKSWSEQADFEAVGTSETSINTTADLGTSMKLDSVTGGVWTQEAPTPNTTQNGTAIAYDNDDTLYILRGDDTNTFWSYSITDKTYNQSLANYGSNVQWGAGMQFVPYDGDKCNDISGCIFATAGNASTVFKRYDILADTWTTLNPVTGTVNRGGGIAWNGSDYIYATRGGDTRDLYRYSISAGTWTPTSLSQPDQTIDEGGSLVYVPNGNYCSDADGCLFTTSGNSTNYFFKYEVNANSWSYMQNSPIWMSYGTGAYYLDGYIYYARGYLANDFLRYDIDNDYWEWLADTPNLVYEGSTNHLIYVPKNDTMYLTHGYNGYSIYAYDVTEDRWRTPAIPASPYDADQGFYYGAITYDSDDDVVYVAAGGDEPDFYAYYPSEERWEKKTDYPMRVRYGASAVYAGGYVYLSAGDDNITSNRGFFFRYDPDKNIWERMPDSPTELLNGGKLIYDSINGDIYAIRAGNQNSFYRYHINNPGSGWFTEANVPNTPNTGSCAVRAQDPNDNKWYIYLMQAENTANMYRYDIAGSAWSPSGVFATAPGELQFADTCVLDNQGNILIPRGNNTTDMYVYNIAGDSWDTRSVLQYYEYGSLVMTNNNIILGFRGESTTAMERYVVATSTTGFDSFGSWTSEVNDFTAGVYGYGGITINIAEEDNTSFSIETRTCDDSVCTTPGDWVEVGNEIEISGAKTYSVESDVSQYGQIKVTLVSDQLYSPTIDDLTWNYYTDSTAPNNPSSISAYTDSGKLTGIINDTWASDNTPYFEWTATDNTGGIGIDGFYVYFGNDDTMDPLTDADDPTNLAYDNGTNYYSVAADGTTGVWDTLTQSASALTSDTYHLIIRTKDRNGNTADSSGELFKYKLDIATPNRPTGVTATPGSWTSTNDFSFAWPTATDLGDSGIKEYCYYINDVFSACTSGISVSGITAPHTRENTFCVYSVDNANNTSATCRERTFYYAGDAPSAPGAILVDPVTSELSPLEDVNQFSFTWDLPSTCLGSNPGECDSADVLRYCYTFNDSLPSAGNCGTNISGTATPSPDGGWTTTTQTSQRSLLSFSAATRQGLNTIHIATADLIGNIDYNNYASADFYFSSNAPGIPSGAAATDTSDRATQKYSVVLTWDEPADLGSGVEGYNIYRCEADCENPSAVDDPPANYTQIATVNTLGYLDTSLDNTIIYSYFVRSEGTGSTQSGNSSVLQIKPEGKFKFAPLMSGQPSVNAFIRSAVIDWLTLDDQDQYGNIVPHPASSYIEYGETSAYGNEAGTPDLTSAHSVTLTNLKPDTTYHYRARWEDQDSNKEYSSDFTFVTKGAPSAPINLVSNPESNTTNSFSFTWGTPQDEGVTVVGYYYTINNLPNDTNVTYTEESSVGPIDAASQQGTNTFYVLAVDDGGNYNFDNYAVVNFEAYTTPPTSPQAITITDSSDRDAKRYSITITWDPPEGYTLEDEIYYTIYRKDAKSAAQSGDVSKQADVLDGFEEIATITSTGYLDTGLDSATEYFYQVTARDKAQATSAPTKIVSEIPEGRFTQPAAITEAPSVVPDSFSALVTWRTERITTSFVEFGTSVSDLSEEQGTSDQVESHEVKVTGLKPETKYFYRIKSIDNDENVAYSEVDNFTTLEAPRVLDVTVSDVKLYDAIIQWNTNKEVTSVVQYGTTTNYGLSYTDISGSFALTHTIKLEGLSDSTTYNIRIGGVDRNGNPVTSDNYTFSTLTFPTVLDVSYENKSEGQTEIYWTTNVPTTSEVEYYSEKIPPKTQGNTAQVTEHTILLFGLEDATIYNFKVRGSDVFGYEAISDEREFVTLEDTTAPTISGVKSESNTIGAGEDSKVQIIISWKTDEPTTSQVDYGVGLSGADYTDQTEENAELVMDHLAVVSGLSPAKTYHFRAVSSDKAGNQTKSGSYTVLTSRKRESFLQLIISNLEETFSWIGRLGGTF